MKSNAARSAARPFLRAGALAIVLTTVVAAVPAGADVPENFSDPAPVSLLEALVVIVAIPVGLALIITLLVLGPSMVRQQRRADADAEAALTGGAGGAAELTAGGDHDEVEAASRPSLEK